MSLFLERSPELKCGNFSIGLAHRKFCCVWSTESDSSHFLTANTGTIQRYHNDRWVIVTRIEISLASSIVNSRLVLLTPAFEPARHGAGHIMIKRSTSIVVKGKMFSKDQRFVRFGTQYHGFSDHVFDQAELRGSSICSWCVCV